MVRVLLLIGIITASSPLFAQTSTSASRAPSLEQRVADLEAYVNNSARGADSGTSLGSNVSGPGPGRKNAENFRVFSPDETSSNRWNAVFEVTDRCSTAEEIPQDA